MRQQIFDLRKRKKYNLFMGGNDGLKDINCSFQSKKGADSFNKDFILVKLKGKRKLFLLTRPD